MITNTENDWVAIFEEIEEIRLNLIGLSQVYDPDLALLEPASVSNANVGTIAMIPTNNEFSTRAKNGTSMEQFFNAMKALGNTFMNCTFNFKWKVCKKVSNMNENDMTMWVHLPLTRLYDNKYRIQWSHHLQSNIRLINWLIDQSIVNKMNWNCVNGT